MNVYGLSIGSSSVRIAGLAGKELKKEFVSFGPDVFQNGKLKNWKPLLRSLIILRSKLKKVSGKAPVIFSLPECGVQLRRFNLPAGKKEDISASAALNLQTISPIDVRDAYYDWQKLDGEFLGAFVHRGAVEQYLRLLNEAGFLVLAVEFSALSLARLIKEQASALDLSRPHLAVFVSEGGLEFLVIKNGNLYSRHFINLSLIKNLNEALIQGAEAAIGKEAISGLILIALELHQKIEPVLKEHFPNLRIKPLALPAFFGVSPVWYVSLGSALRGAERGEKLIDLSPSSSQEEIKKLKKQNFVLAWQKLILEVSAFAAVLLLAGAVSVNLFSNWLEKKIEAAGQNPEFQEAQFLKKVQIAKAKSNDFSGILEKLRLLAAQNDIVFARLVLKGEEGKIILNGSAEKETDIIKFKDKLLADGLFKDAVLPLSDIIAGAGGGVNFELTLNL